MISKADQARLDAIHDMPCVCCLSMKVEQPNPTEANHIVDKGYRRLSGGHQATNALCGWHHRAVTTMGYSQHEMLVIWGPSMKYQEGKGEFERCFGTQRELLDKTNEFLNNSLQIADVS